MDFGFLTLDYDEGDQGTYRELNLKLPSGEDIKFNTGDPIIDYMDYNDKIHSKNFFKKHNMKNIVHSSSIDNWLMDGEEYLEELFDPETGEILDTSEIDDEDVLMEIYQNYPRRFFLKDMTNFNDLREYYIQYKLKNKKVRRRM